MNNNIDELNKRLNDKEEQIKKMNNEFEKYYFYASNNYTKALKRNLKI